MGVSKVLKITQKVISQRNKMDFIRGQKSTLFFFESLISKYDTGPVKLPGLSRNGPQGRVVRKPVNVNPGLNVI